MDQSNILDRLGMELIDAAIQDCCSVVQPCEFHHGYIDGIDRMIDRVNHELEKVGFGK